MSSIQQLSHVPFRTDTSNTRRHSFWCTAVYPYRELTRLWRRWLYGEEVHAHCRCMVGAFQAPLTLAHRLLEPQAPGISLVESRTHRQFVDNKLIFCMQHLHVSTPLLLCGKVAAALERYYSNKRRCPCPFHTNMDPGAIIVLVCPSLSFWIVHFLCVSLFFLSQTFSLLLSNFLS